MNNLEIERVGGKEACTQQKKEFHYHFSTSVKDVAHKCLFCILNAGSFSHELMHDSLTSAEVEKHFKPAETV